MTTAAMIKIIRTQVIRSSRPFSSSVQPVWHSTDSGTSLVHGHRSPAHCRPIDLRQEYSLTSRSKQKKRDASENTEASRSNDAWVLRRRSGDRPDCVGSFHQPTAFLPDFIADAQHRS
jgi:hypothetical protein